MFKNAVSSVNSLAPPTIVCVLQADLESRETRILELVDETERKEEVIHRLMAELRGLQSQLQKAPVTPVRKRKKYRDQPQPLKVRVLASKAQLGHIY